MVVVFNQEPIGTFQIRQSGESSVTATVVDWIVAKDNAGKVVNWTTSGKARGDAGC